MQMERAAFWANVRDNRALVESSMFRCDFAASFKLDQAAYRAVRLQAMRILAISADVEIPDENDAESELALLQRVGDLPSFGMRRDLDEYAMLEAALTSHLRELGLLAGVAGIEFPVNLRVIHSNPAPWIPQRTYATDHIHCDPWAGEPADQINGFLFVEVDGADGGGLGLLEVSAAQLAQLERFEGPYKRAAPLLAEVPEISYTPCNGQMILFDGFTPHWTKRGTAKPRLSIDFRMRREHPYAVIDERWTRDFLPWSRFWFLQDGSRTTIAARYESEIEALSAGGHVEAARFRADAYQRLSRSATPRLGD